MKTIPNIIDVIRTYRQERGWPLDRAANYAIEQFRKRGWPIPPAIEKLYGYQDKIDKALKSIL